MRTFTCTGMKERWNSSAVLSNTSRSTTRSGYISRWIIAPPRGCIEVGRSTGSEDRGGGGSDSVAFRSDFRGMAPASDGREKSPWASGPGGRSAIGAPSAELSLGELRARRTHLRFTRQYQGIAGAGCFARASAEVTSVRTRRAGRTVAKDFNFLV